MKIVFDDMNEHKFQEYINHKCHQFMCNNTLVEFLSLVFHLIWVRRGLGGLGRGRKGPKNVIRHEPYWKLCWERDLVDR